MTLERQSGSHPYRRGARAKVGVRPSGRAAVFRRWVALAILVAAGSASLNIWPGGLAGTLPAAFGLETPQCGSSRVLTVRTPPMRGGDVAEVQLALRELALYTGPIDGVFSPATGQAAASLRERAGLSPVPRVDAAFWKALEAEWWASAPASDTVLVAATADPAGELLIIINMETRRLTLYEDGYPFKSYPVAVGKPSTPSQPGQWKIRNRGVNVGPQYGTRWMALTIPWGVYGVHGTNNPGSIGTAASGGCIRMFNHNVEELYRWVSIGTPVHIVSPHWTASVPSYLRQGSGGLAVVFLQWQMQRLGFYPGDADGRYGETTVLAVRNLEAFYGLAIDGAADTDVLCLLDLDR